jgi:hypothetical protein
VAGESKRKSIFQKNPTRVITGASIILSITAVLFFVNENIPRFGSPRSNRYQKQCFSNQRVLLGAIEIYNMEHTNLISNYNPDVLALLIKDKCLKENPLRDCECEYLVEGDLTRDGYIYCVNHGSANGEKKGENIEASTNPKRDSRERLKKNLIKALILFGPTLLYLIISFI